MQLRAALALVRAAVGKGDGRTSHVRIADGRVQADDGVIAASAPVMALFEAVVPGDELVKVLDSCSEEPSAAVVDGRLVFKARRFKADLATLTLDSFPAVERPADARPLPDPEGLYAACATIGRLVEDGQPAPWQSAMIVDGGSAIVVGARAKIVVERPLRGDHGKFLIPPAAVKYVAERGAPRAAWAASAVVIFEWADDSWLLSRLVAADVPAQVRKMLDGLASDGWAPSDAWRASLERLARLAADNTVTLSAATMSVTGPRATVEDESDAPLPMNAARTPWSIDVLQVALSIATKIDVAAWPRPATILGDGGLRGLMAVKS